MEFSYHRKIDDPFAYGYLSKVEQGKYIAMGEGLYQECLVMPIQYDKDVGLFECVRPLYCAGYRPCWGIFTEEGIIERKKEKFPEYADFFRAIEDILVPLNTDKMIEFSEYRKPDEIQLSIQHGFMGGTWGGHTQPDYGKMLKMTGDGLREKINKYRKIHPYVSDFYDGLERVLEGMEAVGRRTAELAAKMAAETESEKEKEHFLALSRAMSHFLKGEPYDFLSAAQFFWMYFSYDTYDSPGRLDQIFLPYWKKTPYEEAFSILDGIWIGFHKHRTWNVCISGSDEYGNDMTNEISFAFLELVGKHRFQTPNLTMRCHENTDPVLMQKAAEALATGCGIPALYNDRVVCKMFMEKLGIPAKDAHEYAMNGCNQIDIPGKSHMGLEDGNVNLYKCMELYLHRGMCTITGEMLGRDFGDPTQCTTFEEVLAGYKKEVEYVTETACRHANACQRIHAECAPNLWCSLVFDGCIEKGRDFKNGGPIYNHGQMLTLALADAVDSLAAIRYHVFEKKNFTMEQLIHALETDFADNEVMRQMLSEKPARFGNGDADTDALAKEVVEHYFGYLLTIPTFRGGWYTGGCSPFKEAAEAGECTGAAPNGRHKADPLTADSIGATPGRDEEGPTALLNSVLELPHHLAGSGFILNIKFDKDVFNTKEGMENFIALWKTYFEQGGQQLSVTVVSAEELLDAKVHPENHRDLIVRVGGYSDYFVNISPGLQDNVIARTGYGR